MNRTIEDSKGFDIVCMSFGKEQEKGIKLVKAGKKDSFIEADSMEIKAGDCELLENGNLEKENGNIIVNFADYKQAKENNNNRITEFAIQQAKREGKLVDFNNVNKRKNQEDSERIG